MKRIAWTILLSFLFLTYYLSSIPGLEVVPVLRQVNNLLRLIDLSMTDLASSLAARLPEQLDPAKDAASNFYYYALANPDVAEFLLRKSAHVLLFFFITVAFFLLLRQYLKSSWKALFGAALLSTVVACLDEFYQTFIPYRSGNIVDVFINMIGILLAFMFISFAMIITWRRFGVKT